jgi:hypothetical protein
MSRTRRKSKNIHADSKGAMITPSLVQCPTCHSRRDFVRAEPAVPKKDGTEIRTFACRPCASEMRYMITRHGFTLLAS